MRAFGQLRLAIRAAQLPVRPDECGAVVDPVIATLGEAETDIPLQTTRHRLKALDIRPVERLGQRVHRFGLGGVADDFHDHIALQKPLRRHDDVGTLARSLANERLELVGVLGLVPLGGLDRESARDYRAVHQP